MIYLLYSNYLYSLDERSYLINTNIKFSLTWVAISNLGKCVLNNKYLQI